LERSININLRFGHIIPTTRRTLLKIHLQQEKLLLKTSFAYEAKARSHYSCNYSGNIYLISLPAMAPPRIGFKEKKKREIGKNKKWKTIQGFTRPQSGFFTRTSLLFSSE